jgi:hypothetical protein
VWHVCINAVISSEDSVPISADKRQPVESTVEGSVVVAVGSGEARAASSANTSLSICTAPALSSGSLPLPHFGDCTHDGQPCWHSHASIAAAVADNQVLA